MSHSQHIDPTRIEQHFDPTKKIHLPEPWEVFRAVTDRKAPRFARALGISADRVNTMGRRPAGSDDYATGRRNYLAALRIVARQGFKMGRTEQTKALLAWLPQQFGYGIFLLPDAETFASFSKGVAKLAKEFGEAVQAISTSLEDRNITKKEAATCDKELKDLAEQAQTLRAALAAAAEETA